MPEAREAQLLIHDVRVNYGAIEALRGVSFEVRPGDFVGIIGPNGSGKSTLLKTVARVLQPQRGAVLLEGIDLRERDTREIARMMGVVPQESPIVFEFSTLEVVLMGRSPHLGRFQMESERDLAIARRAMELTDTAHLAERPITALSGGEKQRAIIARALAQEPQILLLDEPTTALDINHQTEIMDILTRLNGEQGVTILVVFHDLNLAAQYCDYLVALREGSIFAIGRPAEVLTEENIRDIYAAPVIVGAHPTTGRPQVSLLPKSASRPARG